MKVEINYRRCEGHAVCVAVAPEVFDIGDDDEQVRLTGEEFDDSLYEVTSLAARRCPIQAIRVIS